MSGAYKTLKKSDVQVYPYSTNKLWTVTTASYNSLGVRFFVGQQFTSESIFSSGSDPVTTDSASGETRFRRLVYNTVKQLYYTNYISSSFLQNTSSFDNFEQNTIYYLSGSTLDKFNSSLKYFPTGSGSIIRVMSIPKNIIGSKIIPSSFQVSSSMYNVLDDGEGNLIDRSGSNPIIVGNIIYPHGLLIITNPSYSLMFPTSSSDSFTSTPGQKSGSFNMVFKGDYTIYENEIRCTVHEDEFNYTLNPSVISGSTSGSLYDFATGSTFNPYITTVGLHNEAGDLLAVGKMSKPVPVPRNSDLTILVKWDS